MKFTGGLPETACGAGSLLKTTENLRQFLPLMFYHCGIGSLIDAPCGDGNWISQTKLTGIEYMGVDLSRENLSVAVRRNTKTSFEPKSQTFACADIASMEFPPVDAVLCRDFFQHLKTEVVLKIIENIRKSNVLWLLATSFDNEINEEVGPDGFRPLNLHSAPFNFPEAGYAIDDPPGSGRILGAWRL